MVNRIKSYLSGLGEVGEHILRDAAARREIRGMAAAIAN